MVQFIKKIQENDDSKLLKQLDDFIYQGICNENGLSDLNRKYCLIRVSEGDFNEFYNSSSYYCNINHFVGMPRITLLHSILTGKCGIYLQNSSSDKTITIRKENYIHLFFNYLHTITGYKEDFYYRIKDNMWCKYYPWFYDYTKIDEVSLSQNPKFYYMVICNMSNIYYSLNRESEDF